MQDLLVLLLVLSPAANADFSVGDAVRIAVQNNPRIIAAARDIGGAASGERSARALADPGIVLAPGITSISGSSDELLVQQPLEINGTRSARAGVARAELRGSEAQAALALRDVVFGATRAYWELARSREQAAAARELLGIADDADRVARRQVELGTRPGIDLAQTGIEVSRARREVTLADGQAAAALAALNTALGRLPTVPVGTLTSLSAAAVDAVDKDQFADDAASDDALMERAVGSRAEVGVESANRDRFRQEARLARAEGVPDLAPQFRIGSFTRGVPAASTGGGAGVGLGITLPLIDYGSRRERIRQANEAARAAEARVTAAQGAARQDVAESLARLRASVAVVRDFRSGVLDQAKRLLDGSRLGFQEGRLPVVALLEAQRSYVAVQRDYIDALADAAEARASLNRAIGTAALPSR